MNILVASMLLFGTTSFVFAQGQVDFANLAPGLNAPVSDASGNRIFGPSQYVADLFWSTNINASMDSLTPAGDKTPFASTNNYGAGYFFGGAITFYSVPGAQILVQVRVWDTTYGSTYYEARDNGGEFGFSDPFFVVPNPPPGTPSFLYGLQSFQLQRLPRLAVSPATTNTILLSWPVEVTTYAVQQSHDLSPTNWVTLTNTPVVVGSQNEITLPNPPGRMFYRLVSQ